MGTHPIFESDFDCLTESMSPGCVCKGIRICALCENLEETKIRRQKFKKNPDRETVIQQYDFDKPQIGGILVIDNFITVEEQNIIAERMNKVYGLMVNPDEESRTLVRKQISREKRRNLEHLRAYRMS